MVLSLTAIIDHKFPNLLSPQIDVLKAFGTLQTYPGEFGVRDCEVRLDQFPTTLMPDLCRWVKITPWTISVLSFSNTKINQENFGMLLEALQTAKKTLHLSFLRFPNAGITDACAPTLCAFIEHIKALPTKPGVRGPSLDLSQNNLSDKGALRVVEAFEGSPFTALDISGNPITPAGVRDIVTAVPEGSPLQHLHATSPQMVESPPDPELHEALLHSPIRDHDMSGPCRCSRHFRPASPPGVA